MYCEVNLLSYSYGSNLLLILSNTGHDMKNLLYRFKINSLKTNPRTFQFMIIGKKNRLNIPIREEKTAKEKNAGEKKMRN